MESLSDIVAEMRTRSREIKEAFGGRPDGVENMLDIWADRIEAAAKREVVSKTETTTVGNAAALREAVVALLDVLDSLGCDESTATLAAFVPDMADSSARCLAAFRKAKAALAAPARNCDLFGGDPKMLNTAWFDWTASPSGHDANGAAKMTFAGWLLAPAAERKGEDYGK